MTHQVRRRCVHKRRGTAIVEMAVVAPLLMLFLMGIIEIGYVLFVHNVMINAVHQGAKIGIVRDGADEEDIIDAVMSFLADAKMDGLITRVDVTPTITVVGTDTTVRVQVVLPYSKVAIFGEFLSSERDIGSTCTMYK